MTGAVASFSKCGQAVSKGGSSEAVTLFPGATLCLFVSESNSNRSEKRAIKAFDI